MRSEAGRCDGENLRTDCLLGIFWSLEDHSSGALGTPIRTDVNVCTYDVPGCSE